MSLDDYVQKYLNNPNIDDAAKNDIQSLMASHLVTGMRLQEQGLLREAIEEFTKENNRPIKSDIDKEITQKSYWHIGTAYRMLGKIQNAKDAFEKALELWRLYGVGSAPHYDLAEILIEEGKFNDAIAICQELLDQIPDGGVKELLAKALAMKKDKLE